MAEKTQPGGAKPMKFPKRWLVFRPVFFASTAISLLFEPALAQSDLETLVRQRGQSIVAQTFGVLSSNLTTALSQGGVSNALKFCSVQALPLTAAVAATNQVTLRRVSHKARNPTNRADLVELAVLDDFRASLSMGKAAAAIVRTNHLGGATFFAPIVLNNPLCLNCHGQSGRELKLENLALISQLYPKDQATGFKLGDLRGLWRIDFPPESSAAPPKSDR